ncbi:hypothetical protein QBC36DRAFT_99221 [Triangularia setosa]|uniref:SSCRP protein n=1 Tax=Triangularia setosa TaxID=2587417 RepID=A0AAN7A2Z9_9PEZI|nr:hypothetical protein QBC36DRAFT_99221 [Podospora setosa]
MKPTATALLAFLAPFTAVKAVTVSYYWNTGCTGSVAVAIPGAFGNGACYGYEYSNTNSAEFVACDTGAMNCHCDYYRQDNCANFGDSRVLG